MAKRVRSKLNTEGEKITARLFKEKFGLDLKRITDQGKPDFIVVAEDAEVAVCEVKDVKDVPPSEVTGWKRESEDDFWVRTDNTPSRVRNKIYEAEKQLRPYELPKIIVLVGFDGDANDLNQAMTGFLPYTNQETGRVMHVSDRRDTYERVLPVLEKTDLYVWIKPDTEEVFFRYFDSTQGPALVERYFKNPVPVIKQE